MTPTERESALARLREAFPESAGWRVMEEPDTGWVDMENNLVSVTVGTLRASNVEEAIASWNAVADRDALLALVPVLRELSCLGNGDRPGNSTGNELAQRALAALPPHLKEV